MRLKEQRLWDTMRRNKPQGVWLQRVENVAVVGMPDVYCAPRGVWVELKAPKAPKRWTTKLLGTKGGLSVDQINWHLEAAKHGITSFVLVRDGLGRIFLASGQLATTMNGWSVADWLARHSVPTWGEVYRRILS